jgi:hypothetical protein
MIDLRKNILILFRLKTIPIKLKSLKIYLQKKHLLINEAVPQQLGVQGVQCTWTSSSKMPSKVKAKN